MCLNINITTVLTTQAPVSLNHISVFSFCVFRLKLIKLHISSSNFKLKGGLGCDGLCPVRCLETVKIKKKKSSIIYKAE